MAIYGEDGDGVSPLEQSGDITTPRSLSQQRQINLTKRSLEHHSFVDGEDYESLNRSDYTTLQVSVDYEDPRVTPRGAQLPTSPETMNFVAFSDRMGALIDEATQSPLLIPHVTVTPPADKRGGLNRQFRFSSSLGSLAGSFFDDQVKQSHLECYHYQTTPQSKITLIQILIANNNKNAHPTFFVSLVFFSPNQLFHFSFNSLFLFISGYR